MLKSLILNNNGSDDGYCEINLPLFIPSVGAQKHMSGTTHAAEKQRLQAFCLVSMELSHKSQNFFSHNSIHESCSHKRAE